MGREGETAAQRRERLRGVCWIGVDLDATLAEYTSWRPDGAIGAPIPLMVERVRAWVAAGHDVRIFTARVGARDAEDGARQRAAIEAWCKEHIGTVLVVTATKDHNMLELWDDRAVQVIGNTGRRADGLAD